MFNLGRKKQVVLYSMDGNADTAARMALAKTRGIRMRRVFTLDIAKVAAIMISQTRVARHIITSDHILRRDIPSRKAFYFITLVSALPNVIGSTEAWFEEEYLPSTAIDLKDAPFRHEEISRQYALGPHKLLLLSAHAPAQTQQRILSEFLGEKVPELAPRHVYHTATHWHREGGITRPLEFLNSVGPLDGRAENLRGRLAGQDALLRGPFPFTPSAKPAFISRTNTILYNAHQALPYHTSGYATRTQGLMHALTSLGWGMHVVTRAGYPRDTKVDPYGAPAITIDNVPYMYDQATGRGQWDLPMDQYISQAAQYLTEQAAAIRPVLIHTASNYMCGLAGIEAARRLDLPSVYEMRGLWHITRWSKEPEYADTEKFALAEKMELEAAMGADRVIAITVALKEWLIDRGVPEGKIGVAPNAVDLEQFAVRAPDVEFARSVDCEGKIVIGYIGSFVQYEGLDILLNAFAGLPQEMRDRTRLLWVGDGPVLEELLEQAKTLGIRGNIVSLGRRPFDEVPRAYSIVDITVFPRKGQPICEIVSPLKPFEAMAMQKAIIVSDVRPLREVVEHGRTGLIHTKDDADSLREQLAAFIGDEGLRKRCGAAARAWVEKTRQWRIIAQNISDVYKDVA